MDKESVYNMAVVILASILILLILFVLFSEDNPDPFICFILSNVFVVGLLVTTLFAFDNIK